MNGFGTELLRVLGLVVCVCLAAGLVGVARGLRNITIEYGIGSRWAADVLVWFQISLFLFTLVCLMVKSGLVLHEWWQPAIGSLGMAIINLHCQHRDEGGTRCDKCVARIQNGVLFIPQRHHGESHELTLTLEQVKRLIEQDMARRDPALRERDTMTAGG